MRWSSASSEGDPPQPRPQTSTSSDSPQKTSLPGSSHPLTLRTAALLIGARIKRTAEAATPHPALDPAADLLFFGSATREKGRGQGHDVVLRAGQPVVVQLVTDDEIRDRPGADGIVCGQLRKPRKHVIQIVDRDIRGNEALDLCDRG